MISFQTYSFPTIADQVFRAKQIFRMFFERDPFIINLDCFIKKEIVSSLAALSSVSAKESLTDAEASGAKEALSILFHDAHKEAYHMLSGCYVTWINGTWYKIAASDLGTETTQFTEKHRSTVASRFLQLFAGAKTYHEWLQRACAIFLRNKLKVCLEEHQR